MSRHSLTGSFAVFLLHDVKSNQTRLFRSAARGIVMKTLAKHSREAKKKIRSP